jgi:hypothetical protein
MQELEKIKETAKEWFGKSEDFVKKNKVLSGIIAGVILFLLLKKKKD